MERYFKCVCLISSDLEGSNLATLIKTSSTY